MKKKIIFVTKALWIGGIETALINLLNHFNYNKYDVTLLVLHGELNLLGQVRPECRVLVADRGGKNTFSKKYEYEWLYHLTEDSANPSIFHKIMMWSVPIIKWIENELYIRYVRKAMKEERYDVAIIYSDVVAEIGIRSINANRFLMFYHHGKMRHVYHDRIAYQKCDNIIAVSNNQANELKKYVPQAARKIVSIHNLTNVEGIRIKANSKIQEVFDSNKFNIVSVGRVSHEKGMDIAVKVCAKLVEKGLRNICWWIIGDGPAFPEVQNAIKKFKMEKYIVLVGMRSNPYPYICQADLYVQPSRFEGYPMTILEALVLGQPVISTDNNGAKEILQDGVTGLLCPVNVEALAGKIISVMQNPELYNILKQNVQNLDFKEANEQDVRMLENLL